MRCSQVTSPTAPQQAAPTSSTASAHFAPLVESSVSSGSEKKQNTLSEYLSKAWGWVKWPFVSIWKGVLDIYFYFFGTHPLQIIEDIVTDPEEAANQFAADFNPSIGKLILAILSDPKKVQELSTQHEDKFKKFFTALGKQIEGKNLLPKEEIADVCSFNNLFGLIQSNTPLFQRVLTQFAGKFIKMIETQLSEKGITDDDKKELAALSILFKGLQTLAKDPKLVDQIKLNGEDFDSRASMIQDLLAQSIQLKGENVPNGEIDAFNKCNTKRSRSSVVSFLELRKLLSEVDANLLAMQCCIETITLTDLQKLEKESPHPLLKALYHQLCSARKDQEQWSEFASNLPDVLKFNLLDKYETQLNSWVKTKST